MASEQDKERLRARFRKALPHLVSREEEARRKQAGKAKRAATRGDKGRSRDDWDEEDAGFVKMKRPTQTKPTDAAQPNAAAADLQRATVVAVHTNQVQLDTGAVARLCARLASDPEFKLAVGDEVAFATTAGPARIDARLPRRSWLGRPDPGNPHRALVLAANVDLAVIVVSVADPPLRPGLIDRFLLALQDGGAAPLVCVNKVDLLAADDVSLHATLQPYRDLGIAVVTVSADSGFGIAELRAHLTGKTCVFVGHSGVGKSSLLNAIDPQTQRRVGAVAEVNRKGTHTTTSSQLRTLADGTRVIDTPGIRAFGVDGLSLAQIRAGFPEFASAARNCRFANCTHRDEPDCAVRAAAAAATLPTARYQSYLRIISDAAE